MEQHRGTQSRCTRAALGRVLVASLVAGICAASLLAGCKSYGGPGGPGDADPPPPPPPANNTK